MQSNQNLNAPGRAAAAARGRARRGVASHTDTLRPCVGGVQEWWLVALLLWVPMQREAPLM